LPLSIMTDSTVHSGTVQSGSARSGTVDSDAAVSTTDTTRTPTTLRVRLVYLARLRDALGCADETLSLPATGPMVRDVLDRLTARGGAFARELAPGRAFRVAVNHAMANADTIVRDNDEVAILPPVTGG
jgi:molybdopterin synthase sulfur carrier subunit